MNETEERRDERIEALGRQIESHNMMQLRIDPSYIIEQIKMFLNSEIETVSQDENGILQRNVIGLGMPKANKEGVASILNFVSNSVNTQTVQANFPTNKTGQSDMYDEYIYSFQMNLGDMIMINLYKWDINEEDIPTIIDGLMNLIVPYMTRPIGDKERGSYINFKEVNQFTNKAGGKSGFKLFGD